MILDVKGMSTKDLWSLRDDINTELSGRNAQCKPAPISKEVALKSVRRFHDKGGDLKPEVLLVNQRLLLSMPVGNREAFDSKRKYLRCLLGQDWSHLFSGYSEEPSDFYVYAHIDPRKPHFACEEINMPPCLGEPFYIGKGRGDRAHNLKRNQGHGKHIAYLIDRGYSPDSIVRVLFSSLSEQKAMEIEAKLIYFFGTLYEKNRVGTLVNLDLSKRPLFVASMGTTLSPKVRRLANEAGLLSMEHENGTV